MVVLLEKPLGIHRKHLLSVKVFKYQNKTPSPNRQDFHSIIDNPLSLIIHFHSQYKSLPKKDHKMPLYYIYIYWKLNKSFFKYQNRALMSDPSVRK